MKEGAKAISIIGAVVAPAALSALTAQLYYVCGWKAQWPQVAVMALAHVVSLAVLYWFLDWRWWIKIFAAIPFIALSLVATVYVYLMVAAAHGDAL